MKTSTRTALVLSALGFLLTGQAANGAAQEHGCTLDERREALRALQSQVLKVAPTKLDSLKDAVQPGGPLAGGRLTHGHVVMAHTGAAPVSTRRAKDPMPQLLQYAPSPSSSPAEWLDFDGPDGPYHLIGWAYLVRFEPGSRPPSRRCIAESEWFIHEAGWHLMDGGMLITPDAVKEPPRPQLNVGIYYWHPRFWDIHFWIGDDGVPTISYANPKAPRGGLHLPDGAAFYLVNGRKELPSK